MATSTALSTASFLLMSFWMVLEHMADMSQPDTRSGRAAVCSPPCPGWSRSLPTFQLRPLQAVAASRRQRHGSGSPQYFEPLGSTVQFVTPRGGEASMESLIHRLREEDDVHPQGTTTRWLDAR